MKKVIFFCVLLFGSHIIWAQNDSHYLTKNINKSINLIEVTNSGPIEVKGGFNTTTVSVYITSNGLNKSLSEEEIAKRIKNYTLQINETNGVLSCVAIPNSDNVLNLKNSLNIKFVIETSSKLDINLKTSGGKIHLTKLDGSLKFKTSGGSISLLNLKGNIEGSTSGGSISLNEGSGNINLRTSGGSITAKNVSGNSEFITSGGSLNFENIKGNIDGKTSGGSIVASNLDGSTHLKTSGGSITINNIKGDMTAATSGGSIKGNIISIDNKLQLTTSAGSVRVDIPFSDGLNLDLKGNKIISDKLAKVSDNLKTGVVKGKINGGGKDVIIKTSVGSIYID